MPKGVQNAGDRSLLRRINQRAALDALRDQPDSITALAARIGLSRTATQHVVDDLMSSGWVDEAAPTPGGMGRPARRFRFCADAGVIVGLDIGAHKTLAAVTDLGGRVLATARDTVSPHADQDTRLLMAHQTALQALAGAGLLPSDVWLVSAASPGVVEAGVVRHLIGLPGWEGLDLRARLTQLFGTPVLVDNDCNLATLAEGWQGVARDVQDLVYVLSGNRTGAGLLLRGRLYRGFAGGAGEIGALPVLGWQQAPDAIAAVSAHGLEPDREAVFAASAQGNAAAMAAVEEFTSRLATGIAALVLALDPELVVLGGGVSKAGDLLMEPLRRHVERLSVVRTPRLEASTLGDLSVALGAVKVAVDHLWARLADRMEADTALPPADRAVLRTGTG